MTIFIARTLLNVAITGGTTRTILQVLAGTQPLRIKEVGVSFNGVDAAKIPLQVDFLRQTTAPAASTTVGALVENQEIGQAALASAVYAATSTEPTAGDVLRTWYITPAGGLWVMQFPLGDEPVVAPAGRIGIRVIPDAAATQGSFAYIVFDE